MTPPLAYTPVGVERHFQLFPEAASTLAHEIDAVFLFMLGLCAATIVLVLALMITFLVRYRKGTNVDRSRRLPKRKRHRLEWIWIILPTLIFLGVFVWAGLVYVKVYTIPEEALQIHVIAKQWMWKAQHPGGQRELNELHVPARTKVSVILASQDVIHSFYVPAFRLKRDVVPGTYQRLWFEADKVGEYHLFCAEYCGSRHSLMRGRIVVMEPAEYAQWLRRQDVAASLAAEGGELFRSYGCSGCHSVNSRVHAPSLTGIYLKPQPLQGGGTVVADEAYLRDSILLPEKDVVAGFEPIMPSFAGQMPEQDLLKIIEFLKSLTAGQEVRE